MLEVRKIHQARWPLRNELGSVDELMSSIAGKGLLQPIVVRPADGGFVIVAGNRRLEACKKLRMSRVPCFIVELDEKEAYEASLIENLQRKTLNPIEEAQAFKRYVDDYGYGGVSELARKIGKSQPYVSNRIALLNLPERIREEVIRRQITPSVAQALSSIDDESEREKLTELIVEKKLTTRNEVRQIVRQVSRNNHSDEKVPSMLSYLPSEENRQRAIDRAFARYIASLKVCMIRSDEVIDSIEDEWVVRETLMQYRRATHTQIDSLMNLRRRINRKLPPA
jgi:ParB family chromosome partitioning protein